MALPHPKSLLKVRPLLAGNPRLKDKVALGTEQKEKVSVSVIGP